MSSSQYREPTNDELWAQPPASTVPNPGPQGLAPIPQVPVPAPVPHTPAPVPAHRQDRTVFALAIVSMALGVPLTAISLSMAGLPGLLLVWVGIVLINYFYGRSHNS
ncbi:MAG: hypothetical protein IT193_04355 [Propionibacteriaceae bacterium]|nr:hypothetical protein [Propionibacteriaceae bacterium]